MNQGEELHLERRSTPRVRYHYTAQFAPNPSLPLKLGKGLTQDLSQKGVQILTSNILDPHRFIEVWIPGQDDEILRARAKVKWTSLEDTFFDNPYWLRCGLELIFDDKLDRIKIAKIIEQKAKYDRTDREGVTTKIGYIF